MKKLFLLSFLFYSGLHSYGQQAPAFFPWYNYTDSTHHLSFSFPKEAALYDTLHLKMYSCSIDTSLALQVHIFDSAYVNMEEPVLYEALQQTENDTMRAFVKLFTLATNSEIIALHDTTISGKRSLEIGLSYLGLETNIPCYTFVKFYYFNNRFFAFTITGAINDLNRLEYHKNIFYNTVNFQ